MSQYPVIDYVGIELETDLIRGVNNFPNEVLNHWTTTRDASIVSDARASGLTNLKIKNSSIVKRLLNRGSNIEIGTEFIASPPMDTNQNYFDWIKGLTSAIRKNGECETSTRSGIHIHVSFEQNLRALKNILVLGRNLEDLFFLLAGMGYEYRGVSTDGAYCRPITSYGPPCVPTVDSHWAQIYFIDDVLKSTSLTEFWYRYGSITGNPAHYHPARYSWLNLVSLLAHGTVEFRIFNKSLNPHYIYAITELCKKFCAYCLYASEQIFIRDGLNQVNSIFKERDKESIIKTFEKFCETVMVNNYEKEILKDILKRTPVPKLKPGFVYSHLRWTPMHLGEYFILGDYHPPFVDEYKIRKPDFTDIHQLRNRG
jgi:hypothetical protein